MIFTTENSPRRQRIESLHEQPFANFEGWAEGSEERTDAWIRVDGWVRIMEAIGCDMLQLGSSDSPEGKIGKERNRFVKDLRELADKLAEKNFRVAYENWCWSTHAPDWEDVWDICKQVDRSNFGLCLDTFQSAGGEGGDPTTSSGMVEDGRTAEQVHNDWKSSCDRLAKIIPKEKIYLLQISDAYKVQKPFEDKEVDGQRPRARWSHDYRPLSFEGYLPVVDKGRAANWLPRLVFLVIFDSRPDGKGRDYELGKFAKHAMECQQRLVNACVNG